MILSVVIVSYNVKFFLEQCLSSLKKAVDGSSVLHSQCEVYIVDNASSDGSLNFLIPLFPGFHFIQNNENTGFAKANNQALPYCSGEFVLFLNPDTILPEDILDQCIRFFQSTPDSGALGVRMIDGAGHYLKESKRGFPSPWASFFKMSGLAGLFPRSKIFAAYYMGNLDERIPQAVEILSGAFMMVRKTILDQTGGFDERFFMYAEDIDLSYRINQNGYQNYYLPGTTIIHFKGESTKKDIRYINSFYTAMVLFLKKHYEGSHPSLHLLLLKLGVRFRKTLSLLIMPFRNRVGKSGLLRRVFVKGDPDSMLECNRPLAEKKIPVSANENEADEIFYCEGPSQTWKSVIAEISSVKKKLRYKFHGASTHAAVGSYSNRSTGEVFEL